MTVISFEQSLEQKRSMKLSDIADTLIYLELRTPEDLVVSRVWKVFKIDNSWIIHSNSGVMRFTSDGQYMATIGHKGGGPSEYNMVFDIAIDSTKKEVILSDSRKILFYDLTGRFLRNINMESGGQIEFSDNIIWLATLAHRTMPYSAIAINEQGDTVSMMPNPYYGHKCEDAGMGVSSSKFWASFYSYNGKLYLKGKEDNDTVFLLNGAERKPHLLFDMGKYKLPVEYEPWYNYETFLKESYRYWGISSVLEDDEYMYITSQRFSDPDGENYTHKESNFRYILYDKSSKESFITDGPEGTRFFDDIQGGPAFWPRWDVDGYYVNAIEWYDLSQELKQGNYDVSPAFQEQFEKWGYDTNSLILLARKKNNNEH